MHSDRFYVWASGQPFVGEMRSSAGILDFCREMMLEEGNYICRNINQKKDEGVSLVHSLNFLSQRTFPVLLVSMMRSAEVNGNLDRTSLHMAEHYDKENRLNGKVRNAGFNVENVLKYQKYDCK